MKFGDFVSNINRLLNFILLSKNSICRLANIIPQKNNEYKKNPPTIIAIIQLMEYL